MKISKKKFKQLIIAFVALLLAASMVIALILIIDGDDEFDYVNDDLSQYIELLESDYIGYEIYIPDVDYADAFVEREIMKLRYQNKTSSDKPLGVTDKAIDVAHRAYIYYRGYVIEDDGSKTWFDNIDTLTGSSVPYDVGSQSFTVHTPTINALLGYEINTVEVLGFDEGLIGAVPQDHKLNAKSDVATSGKVKSGDEVYLLAELADGSVKSYVIDLADADVDTKYGRGFSDFIIGKDIGIAYSDVSILSENGSKLYNGLKVEYALRTESEPLCVSVSFPSYYRDEALRNREAVIEVYFDKSIVYDAPIYESEEFITETLKVNADDLAEYSGADIVEKHTAKLRRDAEEKCADIREMLIEEAVWDHLDSVVKIKEIPQSEIERIYEERYGEPYYMYASAYGSYKEWYKTVEEFCAAYYGLDDAANLTEYILSLSEEIVLERLIFYYIIRNTEGLLPSEEEYESAYDRTVAEHLDTYITAGGYKTELDSLDGDEKEKRILEIKEGMLEYYGEGYFADVVYYGYALDKVINFAIVKSK